MKLCLLSVFFLTDNIIAQKTHKRLLYQWSGRRDSNSRRSPWQGDALPLSHSRMASVRQNIRRTVVLPDGIEPSTRGFSVPCSTD